MRRWLPFQIMLAVVIALSLLSLQMVFAQTSPTATAEPAGQTLQLQRTDTLVALAARFGKSVACLQKANKMAANNTSLTGMTTIFLFRINVMMRRQRPAQLVVHPHLNRRNR